MNLGSSRVVLRMRGVADILDLAAPFCLRGWRVLLPLMGFFLLPSFAACLAARAFWSWRWPFVWLLAVGLGGICQAPFTLACGELLFHDPREVRLAPMLRRLPGRLPAFLATHVVSRLIHGLAASMLIFLPFTGSALLVVHEVVLLEGAGPFSAIARSGRAVRGQGVSAFGIALALVLLPIAGILAGEETGGALVATVLQLGEPFGTFWNRGGTPYALAGFFLTIPVLAAARFLKYIDLRTRKEGWDIQLQFMEIAASGGDRNRRSENSEEAA
jgi:MFS family permease